MIVRTCAGRLVEEARRVIDMELVLDAKIAETFAILSSSENNLFFMTSDSTMASIITSALLRTSKVDAYLKWFNKSVPASCEAIT